MTNEELEQIYNEAYRAVYWTAMSLLKSEADAEDIVQDTFVAFIESYSDIKDTSKATALLKKIAVNKCLDRIKLARTDNVEDEFFENVEAVPEDFLPDTIVESAEMRKIVMDIINNSLSEDIRRTLILFYFDEMSTKEIAETLGIPQGTVLWRLNFAKKKIKKEVEKYEEDNDTKLFGMAIPFLSKLFTKESEQVVFKPMPASLANLSASAEASGKGVNIKASTEAVKKGTDIMRTKIIIGSIAAVVAVGIVTGIIINIINKKADSEPGKTPINDTVYETQGDGINVGADVNQSTTALPSTYTIEDVSDTKSITDDSVFLRLDGMTSDEIVENLWKTTHVKSGTYSKDYYGNLITDGCTEFTKNDDDFSWKFYSASSDTINYISKVSFFSGMKCDPIFDGTLGYSRVNIELHNEDKDLAFELAEKIEAKLLSEGYEIYVDKSTTDDSWLEQFQKDQTLYLLQINKVGDYVISFEISLYGN